MAKSVLEIVFRTLKQGTGDRETKNAIKDLEQGFKSFMGVAGAVAAVGATVNTVYKNTVNVFVDYAAQVRTMSRMTGLGAEQTSKLIQAADDLTISYESLNKALWAASKQGIDVSIESLATMADEYVAMSSASERAEFLAKKFGKSGAEMGKLLEQGGAGVRQMTDAINGSLVLTDRAVQNAREYEIALDGWNDAIYGVKVAIGNALLPVVTDAIDGTDQYTDALNRVAAAHELSYDQMVRARASSAAFNEQIEAEATNLARAEMMGAAWAARLNEVTSVTEEATIAQEELTRGNQEMLSLIMQLQGEYTNFTTKNEELRVKLEELNAAQDKVPEWSRRYKEYQEQIDATQGEIDKLADKHEEASRRIAFSLLQQKLASDGFTDAEFNNLLLVGESWGLIDRTVAETAINMNQNMTDMAEGMQLPLAKFQQLNQKAQSLKNMSGSEWTFSINIETKGYFPGFPGYAGGGGGGGTPASPLNYNPGGPVAAMAGGGQLGSGWTLVGEEGMELITPSGYVVPSDVTRALLRSGIDPEFRRAFGGSLNAVISNYMPAPPKKKSSGGTSPATVNSEVTQASQTTAAAVATTENALNTASAAQQAAVIQTQNILTTVAQTNDAMVAEQRETNRLLAEQAASMPNQLVSAFVQAVPV